MNAEHTDRARQRNPAEHGDSANIRVDWSAELARHQRWLRTVVAARSGEPQAVDEIMQDIAMAVIQQRAPLRDPRKVAPWLYQVAVRQSLMYRRKHGRRRRLEQRYAEQAGPPCDAQSSALDWLVAGERRSLIRQALSRLNPKEAEILLLKYTEDWSYGQIAEHLGISAVAVDSRLFRAREKLRREMLALHVIEAHS